MQKKLDRAETDDRRFSRYMAHFVTNRCHTPITVLELVYGFIDRPKGSPPRLLGVRQL
jgi:hypothetical protein